MKFTRTVRITRTRRELIVPASGPSHCPKCGSELPTPLVPGMPLVAGPEETSPIPSPLEKKK